MQFSWALFGSGILIYVRTVFRMAETASGFSSYASTHEAFFGALEFAPIIVAILVLGWWHPGVWVPKIPRLRSERDMEIIGSNA